MTFPLILLSLLVPLRTASAASAVAGSVVSSKEWKVKRSGTTEEEFIGDVHYRNRATIFTSDWALYKHADQSWRAKGKVRVENLQDGGDVLVAKGDQAAYNQRTQKGSLTGKDGVAYTRTPQDEDPDHGRSDRIEWAGRDQVAAVGAVRIWGPRLLAWADRADYSGAQSELKLTGGRPVLLKLEGFDPTSSDWVGALQGDVVTAYETPHRLTADGKTRGWLDFTQKGRDKGAKP